MQHYDGITFLFANFSWLFVAFCLSLHLVTSQKSKDESQKLKERDGFTPQQRFFLAYANVWANNIRPEEILNRTKSDPHSLGRWRVNGALPQINAWYEAWHVTEESPMYIAPENRVSIW